MHIADETLLKEKIAAIRKAGIDSLHVVADFDRTLTKYHYHGKKLQSAYAMIRDGNYLSTAYVEKAHALFDKYYPIEIDENIPLEEKSRYMQQWWEEHLQLKIACGLNKDVLDDIILRYDKLFRAGTHDFFSRLHELNIPLLIFSSGLGYLIEGFLKKEELLTKNVHVISNFYEFNELGEVTGYKGKIIHVCNKSTIALEEKYLEEIRERKNVILLGDSIGDLGMSDGFACDTIIKIGFLNDKVEERLELYKEKFDIVIAGDADFSKVNELLKELILS